MSPEAQRIAIAEFCGYVWYRAPQDKYFPQKKYRFLALPAIQEYEGQIEIWKQRADGTEAIITTEAWKKAQGVDYVPDYRHDLNAMHEVEKLIKHDRDYFNNLKHVVFLTTPNNEKGDTWFWGSESHNYKVSTASAAQRAEALLRTIGKWEE